MAAGEQSYDYGQWCYQEQMDPCGFRSKFAFRHTCIYTDVTNGPQGNEHVTTTHPDGREVYMINGVEQRPQRNIEDGFIPPSSGDRQVNGIPPPPLITSTSDRHRARGPDAPY